MKKLLALFLSISLIASMFSVLGLTASASENFTVTGSSVSSTTAATKTAYEELVAGKTNLLEGKLPVYWGGLSKAKGKLVTLDPLASSVGYTNIDGATIAGEYANSLTNNWYFTNDGVTGTATPATSLYDNEADNYVDMVYEFEGVANISDVSIFWGTDSKYTAGHYKVSFADKQTDLFTENAVVTEEVTSAYAFATLTANTELKARFIGIRVICGVNASAVASAVNANTAYGRIMHIDVHGTVTPDPFTFAGGSAASTAATKTAYEELVAGKTNLLEGKVPVYWGGLSKATGNLVTLDPLASSVGYTNIDGATITGEYANSLTNKWYFTNDGVTGTATPATSLYDNEADNYVDMVYEFEGVANISDVSIFWCNDTKYTASHYKVSFADKQTDLFTENAVVTEEVTSAYAFATLTANTELKARFIGIRVICGVNASAVSSAVNANTAYGRIMHIDVHGTVTPDPFKVTGSGVGANSTATKTAYEELVAGKTNLLEGKVPVYWGGLSKATGKLVTLDPLDSGVGYTNIDGATIAGEYANSLTNKWYFTNDGVTGTATPATSLYDNEADNYIDLVYEFEGVANISDVSIFWCNDAKYAASHYKVSFANAKDDLFTESAVATEEVNTAYAYSTVTANTELKASFIGIRIICGVNASAVTSAVNANTAYGRIMHIDVHGKYLDSFAVSDISITKPEAITTTLSANGNPDADAKYALGSTIDLSVDKTSYSDDNYDYTFSGWKLGDEVIEGSAVETFTYTVSSAPVALEAVYASSTRKMNVYFEDGKGNVVYSVKVENGNVLSDAVIAEAEKALPNIYGYSFNGWDNSTSEAIIADTRFVATYAHDMETTYDVTIISANGAERVEQYVFDAKLELNEAEAKSWSVDGVLVAVGNSATLYVFGDMTITASADGASEESAINLIGSVFDGNDFVTFARVYNPTGAEIAAVGVTFTSAGCYNMIGSLDSWDDASIASAIPGYTPEMRKQYFANCEFVDNNSEDYMVTLKKVPQNATRYARAYIRFADGSVIWGNIISNVK